MSKKEILDQYDEALFHLAKVKETLAKMEHRHRTEYGAKLISIEVGLNTDVCVLTGNHTLLNPYKGDKRNLQARFWSGNI